MVDLANKDMYIIDKAIEITDALGTPILDETNSDTFIGKSLIVDYLNIECLSSEQGISVYIRSNGSLVLSYSRILGSFTYTKGVWVAFINNLHDKIYELKDIDNVQDIIKELNELKDYYYIYTKCHISVKNDINELLAKEGITITRNSIQSDVISLTSEYPIYNQQNIYSIIVNGNIVGMFLDVDFTSIDFIKQFKPGEWVDTFKRVIQNYIVPINQDKGRIH